MSSKTNTNAATSNVFGLKNREAAERKRPSLHYVDFSDLMVFSQEDLEKELAKIPEQKLRRDDEGILHRVISIKRVPSLTPSNDPLLTLIRPSDLTSHDDVTTMSTDPRQQKKRRKSSILSVASSSCTQSPSMSSSVSSSFLASSYSGGSFFEVAHALSKVHDGQKNDPFPYPDPIPAELRFIEMKDLLSTDIDWKMLTMARPVSRIDEDFFSRLVECARLQEKSKRNEGHGLRRIVSRISRHSRMLLSKYPSTDLTEDFEHLHIQPDFDYESYARQEPEEDEEHKQAVENANELVAKLFEDEAFGPNTPPPPPTSTTKATSGSITASTSSHRKNQHQNQPDVKSKVNLLTASVALAHPNEKDGGRIGRNGTFRSTAECISKIPLHQRLTYSAKNSPSAPSTSHPILHRDTRTLRKVKNEREMQKKETKVVPESREDTVVTSRGMSVKDKQTNMSSYLSKKGRRSDEVRERSRSGQLKTEVANDKNRFASGIQQAETPTIVVTTLVPGME